MTVELYAGACPADLTTLVDRLAVTDLRRERRCTSFDEVAAGEYCVIADEPG